MKDKYFYVTKKELKEMLEDVSDKEVVGFMLKELPNGFVLIDSNTPDKPIDNYEG